MATAPKGYVFRLAPGFFGVLRYRPTTHVEMYQSETTSVFSVCDELRAKYGTEFADADSGQIAWGKLTYKAQGAAVLI